MRGFRTRARRRYREADAQPCVRAGRAKSGAPPQLYVRFHKELTLTLEWTDSLSSIDWSELSALYRAAPLGEKNPADLETAFSGSRFRCFVYDSGNLV